MPITSNSNQDVWGIGSMIAYMLTKKGLSHVFQEKYGMKSYKDVRTHILNLPQHQCMTPEQKNSIQFKRKVSRLLTREINLQYHGVYACPTYSSKDTIDGFKSRVTEPLKFRILDLLTDCFNVDPTLRPSVQHLMSNLSQLTSPISDSTLYSSSESDMGKKIKKQRTLSIIDEP
tara:strand:+ start:3117 stop:3638 length:522 start_codon:yes stop_codon:yes gene_type:complete